MNQLEKRAFASSMSKDAENTRVEEPKPSNDQESQLTDVLPSSEEVDAQVPIDKSTAEEVKESIAPVSVSGDAVEVEGEVEDGKETESVNEYEKEGLPEKAAKEGLSTIPSPYVWTKDGSDVQTEYNTRPRRVKKRTGEVLLKKASTSP